MPPHRETTHDTRSSGRGRYTVFLRRSWHLLQQVGSEQTGSVVGAIDAALPDAAETARGGAAEAGRGSGFDAAFGIDVVAVAVAVAVDAGFVVGLLAAAVFAAVAYDNGELALGARSSGGDIRSRSPSRVSEIGRAPAPPSSSFVERVDVALVFLLLLRHHGHPLLLLSLRLRTIVHPLLFDERIARRGVRLALLLANHSLESLQTTADLAETATAPFQTAAVSLLQRCRR
jgi:hypothetical protein